MTTDKHLSPAPDTPAAASGPGGFPTPGQSRRFDEGLARRRAVLGSDYVDRSIQGADDFTRPLQTMITEWCWGEVWGDETLPPRTRSLLNIAMLSALNRKDELKLHVRGAIHNGVSVAEIRTVLLQAAVYCGVPAALDATKAAREVLKEMGAI